MRLTVRPFESPLEYRRMIDYFLGGDDSFLLGMGVDRAKLPEREVWLQAALIDHERSDHAKTRFYVAWLCGVEQVGHSSISHLQPHEVAHVHLHLWRPQLRRSGLGARFLARSLDFYFARFGLESIVSEPFAGNPAPNRVLKKLGFRFLKRYRTVPSGIASEQEVNRWEITRAEWVAGGSRTENQSLMSTASRPRSSRPRKGELSSQA